MLSTPSSVIKFNSVSSQAITHVVFSIVFKLMHQDSGETPVAVTVYRIMTTTTLIQHRTGLGDYKNPIINYK